MVSCRVRKQCIKFWILANEHPHVDPVPLHRMGSYSRRVGAQNFPDPDKSSPSITITMKSLLLFLVFVAFSVVHGQFNSTLTTWITTENITARGRIFANIAAHGEYATDGNPGAIVAAPSTASPNYYFQVCPREVTLIILVGSRYCFDVSISCEVVSGGK
jgi:hypothetical protein